MTQIRSNFLDFFTESKLPVLEKITTASKNQFPSMIPVLFNQEKMTTDIYQTTTMSGVRNPRVKAEGAPVEFSDMKPGYKKTYSAVTYANAYRISREMVRDGKESMIKRAAVSFGKGFAEVWELEAASVYDNGFTVNGYDGKPLFARDHPLENGSGLEGINEPAAPSELSITSYRELRNILQNTVNEDGQLINLRPKYLVIPQGLQDVAQEILKSTFDPTSGNNNVNTIFNHTSLVPGDYWPYLGSDTAWFLQCDKTDHYLMFLDRDPYETDSDYDKHAFAYEVIASERRAYGASQWRGLAGNPGA